MAKMVTEETEIKELIETYFWYIRGRYFIEALKSFSIGEGYGQECVCCTFPNDYVEWEEGYFGNTGVKMSADYPAVDEDIIYIFSYEEFYKILLEKSDEFINKYQDMEDEVNGYLKKIKVVLGL